MAELNERFRGMEGPTDVLSFECDNIDDDMHRRRSGRAARSTSWATSSSRPTWPRVRAPSSATSFEEEVSLLHRARASAPVRLRSHRGRGGRGHGGPRARAARAPGPSATCPLSPRTAERLRGSPLADDDKTRPLVRRAGRAAAAGRGASRSRAPSAARPPASPTPSRSQRNLKIQAVLGLAAVAAGFALGISRVDWLAIVLCIVVVSVAEVREHRHRGRRSIWPRPNGTSWPARPRTAAAGAVLLASAGSVVVGLIVFVALCARASSRRTTPRALRKEFHGSRRLLR